jgi:uncharacterized membrane protein YraQ (UPF0718 family)
VSFVNQIGHALYKAFAMFWEILWPLILGFFLSGVVQAVVSKAKISKTLGNDQPRTIAIACLLGAASSSCSYAAVALARSLFRKGANFTAAIAFQLASTNLVAELGIILAVLMGWQFTLAEFAGAPIMVAILVFLFHRFLTPEIVLEAKTQADKGLKGSMEGHAEMDMSVTEGSLLKRLLSPKGWLDRSQSLFCDGLGGNLERHCRWLAVGRRISDLGPKTGLAVVLPDVPSITYEVLESASRSNRSNICRSSVRLGMCR